MRGARIGWTAAFAVSAALSAAAQAAWTIDPQATQLHWEVRHYDTSTSRGRFDRIEAQLDYDAAARRGALSVTIATGSVSTGLGIFDGVLRGNSMLDARIHPTATFVSRGFDFDGDRLVAVRGDLTVKDITRPIVLRALRFGCRGGAPAAPERCGGDFEAELKRSDYGIHYGSPFAADRVRLFVSVQAERR